MKKWSLFLLGLTLLSLTTIAEEFVVEEHYQVLEQPLNDKVEVREFFSFYCPHCYRQEPIMQTIAQSLPEDVPFKKNHVSGMPGKDVSVEENLTKALLVAEKLDVYDEIVPAIFNYIHQSKANFKNIKDIQNLFVINGVAPDKFASALKSFSIDATHKSMQKMTALLRQQGIPSVPTLIINGRYRPVTQNITSMEQYTALIHFLVAKGI
ncbi:MAG: thiol:disulfide interchange protein DsbA/DsbL [Aestuariibacter sp.]